MDNPQEPNQNVPPLQNRSAASGNMAGTLLMSFVVLVVILAGIFYYAMYQQKLSAPGTNTPASTLPTYDFSSKSYPGMPAGIVPASNITPPQYWESTSGIASVGGIFIIKKPIAQALPEYKASLAKAGWTIINPKNDPASTDFAVSSKTRSGSIQIRQNPVSATTTVVMFSFTK